MRTTFETEGIGTSRFFATTIFETAEEGRLEPVQAVLGSIAEAAECVGSTACGLSRCALSVIAKRTPDGELHSIEIDCADSPVPCDGKNTGNAIAISQALGSVISLVNQMGITDTPMSGCENLLGTNCQLSCE